jgi:hypothetical protein
MTDSAAAPDPVAELVCSARGCRQDATWGLLWNNPRLHAPERRKVWLACPDHREQLEQFLGVRGFHRSTVPVGELETSSGR